MDVVARHLRDHALRITVTAREDAALFGRSAFNRFYYSAYLAVRSRLDPVISDIPQQHKSIPGFLRAFASKDLRNRKNKALRAEDHSSVHLAQNAQIAARDLAQLLENGYSARVTADYYPDIPVEFDERGFKLNEVSILEAQSWPHKARTFSDIIATALRQTNEY